MIYIYVYVCVCMYVCVYIYIYITLPQIGIITVMHVCVYNNNHAGRLCMYMLMPNNINSDLRWNSWISRLKKPESPLVFNKNTVKLNVLICIDYLINGTRSTVCSVLPQTQQITPQLALQVLLQFDKAINTALANRVRNRVNFRVSQANVTCSTITLK